MRALILDKIASVTRNCHLERRVHVSDKLPCNKGDVVAVRILTSKSRYNKLELVSGRMSTLKPGDVIAGALGHRAALLGFAGHCPTSLKVGDVVNLLNLGGVLGICDDAAPEVGEPFRCEVIGQVLTFPVIGQRVGVPANIQRNAQPMDGQLNLNDVPVVAIAGTSMNSGKTAAAAALIQIYARKGLKVVSGKATGVSLSRDVLSMEDSGATRSVVFTDFGVVTTTRVESAAVSRAILTNLAKDRPDLIVLELGDGILGPYGVDAILDSADLREAFSAVLLCAADPVGSWGAVTLLRDRFGIEPAAVTGPATDNKVGCDIISEQTAVFSANAMQNPHVLANHIWKHITGEALHDL
ncbi:MAG: hypothetical protein GWP91_07365 [Rhodobacterales bacterium]|nr:hypothetical protein [Rhodobacterales bacterium]